MLTFQVQLIIILYKQNQDKQINLFQVLWSVSVVYLADCSMLFLIKQCY